MSEYDPREYQHEDEDRLEDTIRRCACGCGEDVSAASVRCDWCGLMFAAECVAVMAGVPICSRCRQMPTQVPEITGFKLFIRDVEIPIESRLESAKFFLGNGHAEEVYQRVSEVLMPDAYRQGYAAGMNAAGGHAEAEKQ